MRRVLGRVAAAVAIITFGQVLMAPPPVAAATVGTARVASVKTYAYGSNGFQRYDVYRSSVSGRRPAVLVIHGGGWVAGDKRDRAQVDMARRFVSAGYTAVSVNYRLVGRGRVTLDQSVADVSAALDHVRARASALGVDKNRIAVVGSSAGGHLAMMLGTLGRGSSRVKAVVASAGMPALQLQNEVPKYGTGKAAWLRGRSRPQNGMAAAAWYPRVDPFANAGAGDARLLWIGSTRDTYVHPELGWQLAEKLRAAKVSAKVIVPDGSTHTMLVGSYRHREALWRHTLNWVDSRVGAKVSDGSQTKVSLSARRSGSSVVVSSTTRTTDTGDSAPFGARYEVHVARREGATLARYARLVTGRYSSGRESHRTGLASMSAKIPGVTAGAKVKLVIRGNGAPSTRVITVR